MADEKVTNKVKVYEEKNSKGLATWMWLLPVLLLLALGIWFFSRRSTPDTTAAAPLADQTKPDIGAGTQAAGAWTSATIADSIRSKGRVSLDENDVHFASASAALQGDSQAVLDQTAQVLQSNSDWKMRIIGHTDTVGSTASNDQLGHQRASSVMNYLTAHGIDQSRLSIDSKGKTEPVSTNESDAGRAKNRRVELIKQ